MLIGEFQKNTAEKIQVHWETYKGARFVDIRAYYENEAGEWKPTKKGIAVSTDKIEALIKLLKKARQSINGIRK